MTNRSDVISNSSQIQDSGAVGKEMGNQDCGCQEFKRVIDNGGELIVDGSLKVLEPILGKTFDLVEVSTLPVTPIANHVRLYAVGVGTYTVIKALYDDGTTKTLSNN